MVTDVLRVQAEWISEVVTDVLGVQAEWTNPEVVTDLLCNEQQFILRGGPEVLRVQADGSQRSVY